MESRSCRGALGILLASAMTAGCDSVLGIQGQVSTPPEDGGPDATLAAQGDGAIDGTAGDSKGATSDPDGSAAGDGGGCSANEILCEAGCVRTTDPFNCGACGHDCTHLSNVSGALVCSPTNDAGTAFTCTNGCTGGLDNCGGTCVNEQTDPDHCGSCTHACPPVTGATATCTGGTTCGFTCTASAHLCGTGASAFCAADDDATHCDTGSGCAPCPPGPANSSPTCIGGNLCGYACGPGAHLCPGGSCPLSSDPLNCGSLCNTNCPGPTTGTGSASCNGNSCAISCRGGEVLCGSACVNLVSDPANCGACGHSCAVGTSTPACSNGVCNSVFVGGQTNAIIMSLASDGANVYWADSNFGVFQAPAQTIGSTIKLSGASVLLPGRLRGIDVSGNIVVFTEGDGSSALLWSATVGVAGSAISAGTISNTFVYPYGVAFNRENAEPQVGVTATDNSGNFQPFVCTLHPASSWICVFDGPAIAGFPGFDVLFFGGNLYWTLQSLSGSVQAFSASGGVNLATGEYYPQSLADDGSFLYWVTSQNLMRMPNPDLATPPPYATPTTVGSGIVTLPNPNGLGIGTRAGLATDGKYVYFPARVGPKQGIYYVPVAGGPEVELTPTTNATRVLSVNVNGAGQAIFFVDLGGIGGSTPGIYKVAPPL